MLGKPWENKLAAIESKESLCIDKETKILYLGAASGKTASKLSELCKVVYAVEFAPKPASRLVEISKQNRQNNFFLIPIVEDARNPENYVDIVEKVDVLYQDVATRGQADVALRNGEIYLKKGGKGIVCIKARSEDVTEKPEIIYEKTVEELKRGFNINKIVDLEPFYKDHAAIIASKS